MQAKESHTENLPEYTPGQDETFADSVPDYLCQGYRYLMQGDAHQAIALWEKLYARYKSAELCGYLARAHYFQFHFLGGNPADTACCGYLDTARMWAEYALKLNQNSSTGHTMLAIAIGHTLDSGPKLRFSNLEKLLQMRRHLERAISIDNGWAAHLILGIWHRRVAGLAVHRQFFVRLFQRNMPRASFQASIDHFNQVLACQPDNTMAMAEQAYTLSQMGQTERARELGRKCAQMPPFRHPLGALWTQRLLDLIQL